jgi:hypothetical protein
MTEPSNFTPARYACKGRVYDAADGELNVVLAPIQDDGTLGPDKYYQLTKGTRWLRAGAVYEIPTAENGSTIQALTRSTRENGETPRTRPPGNSLPRPPRRKMR